MGKLEKGEGVPHLFFVDRQGWWEIWRGERGYLSLIGQSTHGTWPFFLYKSEPLHLSHFILHSKQVNKQTKQPRQNLHDRSRKSGVRDLSGTRDKASRINMLSSSMSCPLCPRTEKGASRHLLSSLQTSLSHHGIWSRASPNVEKRRQFCGASKERMERQWLLVLYRLQWFWINSWVLGRTQRPIWTQQNFYLGHTNRQVIPCMKSILSFL